MNRCLGLAWQRWLQKTLHTPESISRDYFRNAFKLAENQHLIKTDESDLAVRRQAFADELRTACGASTTSAGWRCVRANRS